MLPPSTQTKWENGGGGCGRTNSAILWLVLMLFTNVIHACLHTLSSGLATNDSFLPDRALLDLYKCILSGAIKFVSVRSS